jgi:hypothetical protein
LYGDGVLKRDNPANRKDLAPKMKTYFIAGGMPAPLSVRFETKDFGELEVAQKHFLSACENDFAKFKLRSVDREDLAALVGGPHEVPVEQAVGATPKTSRRRIKKLPPVESQQVVHPGVREESLIPFQTKYQRISARTGHIAS